MDPVVHFELPVKDVGKARAFYGTIFGWELMEHAMPDGSTYVGVRTTAVDEGTRLPLKPGAINGGILKADVQVRAPVLAISVPSIDERVRQVTAAGGKVIKPKVDLGIGCYAYVADPEGTVIGLWEDAKPG
jgi:predicted enzyme related to lactoylglutathione lyase